MAKVLVPQLVFYVPVRKMNQTLLDLKPFPMGQYITEMPRWPVMLYVRPLEAGRGMMAQMILF